MKWTQVAAAGVLGLGGGFLLGQHQGSGRVVPIESSAVGRSVAFVATSSPEDASACAPPVSDALAASFPSWSFPAPRCELPRAPAVPSAEPAAASVSEGPSAPLCSPTLHEDYFLILSEDGQLSRMEKALNPFGFGYYRGQLPSPMGDHSIINGVPMRVAQMHLSDSANAVLTYYAQQLAMNGIHPASRLLEGEGGPLSLTFELGSEDQNVLILVPLADGTMVLTAVGAKLKKFPDQAQLPESFPRPPDVADVSVDAVSEGKSLQRDIMFTASLDLEHLRSFYQQALASQGFQPEPVSVDKPQRWQQGFFRKDEIINLSAHAESTGRSAVNVIWVTHPISGDEP